jgi:hypothetical protein
MDGSRFDLLTRRWSSRQSRRALLGGLAVGALSALDSRRVPGTAAQTADDSGMVPCAANADCLDGDLDPCTGATCADGVCSYFVVDCVPGFTCCGGGICCPQEGGGYCVSDDECAVFDDPCAGGTCDNGRCVTFLVLCAEGSACCGNGACCPIDPGCVTDADCGSYANPCLRGRCLAGSCVPAFVSCPPGETCRDGVCAPLTA